MNNIPATLFSRLGKITLWVIGVILLLILLSIAGLVLWFVFLDQQDKKTKEVVRLNPPCQRVADPVRIKIGDTVFQIPNKYHFDIRFPLIDGVHPAPNAPKRVTIYPDPLDVNHAEGGYCQKLTDPPFVAEAVMFRDLEMISPEAKVHTINKTIHGIYGLNFFEINHGFSDSSRAYCESWYTQRFHEVKGWNYAPDVPDGIMKSTNTTGIRSSLYYSEYITLFGNPVLVVSGREINHPIANNINVDIRFFNKVGTKSKTGDWNRTLKDIETFIRSISASSLPDLPKIHCPNSHINKE